jgi:hypothetical protein
VNKSGDKKHDKQQRKEPKMPQGKIIDVLQRNFRIAIVDPVPVCDGMDLHQPESKKPNAASGRLRYPIKEMSGTTKIPTSTRGIPKRLSLALMNPPTPRFTNEEGAKKPAMKKSIGIENMSRITIKRSKKALSHTVPQFGRLGVSLFFEEIKS